MILLLNILGDQQMQAYMVSIVGLTLTGNISLLGP